MRWILSRQFMRTLYYIATERLTFDFSSLQITTTPTKAYTYTHIPSIFEWMESARIFQRLKEFSFSALTTTTSALSHPYPSSAHHRGARRYQWVSALRYSMNCYVHMCISHFLLNSDHCIAWALQQLLQALLSQLLNLLGLNSNPNVVTASRRRMFSAVRHANRKVKATSNRLKQGETCHKNYYKIFFKSQQFLLLNKISLFS